MNQKKVPQKKIKNGSSIKDQKKFFNQVTFTRLQNFCSSERELEYYHHKNKRLSCLTTNQLKTQCLRKLESFQKIHKMPGIKSKYAAGQLRL